MVARPVRLAVRRHRCTRRRRPAQRCRRRRRPGRRPPARRGDPDRPRRVGAARADAGERHRPLHQPVEPMGRRAALLHLPAAGLVARRRGRRRAAVAGRRRDVHRPGPRELRAARARCRPRRRADGVARPRGVLTAAACECLVLIALGTAVVLWLPPIVQQLFSDDGNLAAIIEFFRDPPEAQAGWRLAWGIMGTELGPPGAWLAGDELGAFGVLPSGTVPSVLLIAATVAAGLVASRRGSPSAGRLALLVAAACVLGVVATSRITGLDRHVPRAVVVGAGGGRVAVARLVGDVPASGSASPAGRARRRGGGDGGAVRGGHGPRRAGWPARR